MTPATSWRGGYEVEVDRSRAKTRTCGLRGRPASGGTSPRERATCARRRRLLNALAGTRRQLALRSCRYLASLTGTLRMLPGSPASGSRMWRWLRPRYTGGHDRPRRRRRRTTMRIQRLDHVSVVVDDIQPHEESTERSLQISGRADRSSARTARSERRPGRIPASPRHSSLITDRRLCASAQPAPPYLPGSLRPRAGYRRVKVRWVTPLGEETASMS